MTSVGGWDRGAIHYSRLSDKRDEALRAKRDKAFRVRTRPYVALIRADDKRTFTLYRFPFRIFGERAARKTPLTFYRRLKDRARARAREWQLRNISINVATAICAWEFESAKFFLIRQREEC